jgi:chitinase
MTRLLICIYALLLLNSAYSQSNSKPFVVIGYYAGRAEKLDSFQVEKLTHIIFSFCHLKENRLHVRRAADSLTIERMINLKKRNPQLKVLLSLGGWGGCETRGINTLLTIKTILLSL